VAVKQYKCPGCGNERPKRDYAGTKLCPLCRAAGVKLPEEVVDVAPVVVDAPPEVQQNMDDAGHFVFPAVEADALSPSAQELAARILARRSMLAFIKRFKPKYTAGWVHEDICRRLVRFMKAVEDGESPRLLLMCPPRLGKSEIGSRHFAPWALGHHPDWEVIAASHTGSLAMSFSRYIRDLLRDPSYQAVFPHTKLDPQSQSVENWNLTQGGGYLAAGLGGAITGRGAHILLLDDLVKDIEAADSQLQRDNSWEWYISTAYTRLAPGGGVLGIMTSWHDDDWAGRIQQAMAAGEGDKFEVVKYPAINELGDEYILPDDSIVQLGEGELVPEGSRMTRAEGSAIHPERYNLESLLRIKRNFYGAGQQRMWASLYQQNPAPDEGAFFVKAMFRYYAYRLSTKGMHIYQAWDFAITEKQQSDYTVGVTIAQDEHDNLYVLDVLRLKLGDGEELMATVVGYAQKWNPIVIGVEDGQIWKALESTFKKVCLERNFYPSYEVLKPLTDKMVRAQPLRGRMQAGKVWFNEASAWIQYTRTEMLRFPAGKHDDIIDALSWCVRLIMSKSAPRLRAPPVVKSWKDKLNGILRGQSGTSHMAG
jgi:predicted phage terminase large subunit-like protein